MLFLGEKGFENTGRDRFEFIQKFEKRLIKLSRKNEWTKPAVNAVFSPTTGRQVITTELWSVIKL